ncbi:hypothetical protein DL96DRAFT_1617770 [Flagelloscypha sp. PMI_526]|nr:hypothetical protein DL96DRAFT_1617770 [Flagelloscypha sp. PMI_526]
MPNLPRDIVQLLVEFSASCHQHTAQALSLVSHECQFWSDQYLFRFLVERDSEYPISHLLESMCLDNKASPRFIRARWHVRSLSWCHQTPLSLQHLHQFLSCLPNLVQLCFWENFIPELGSAESPHNFDFETTFPNLKRVHTCSFTSYSLPSRGFDYPFWKTVTHLQLHSIFPLDDDESPFKYPMFTTLNQLTHLAIGQPMEPASTEEESSQSLEIIITRVRASFPPSLMLCLLSIQEKVIVEETLERLEHLKLGHEDDRIVLWAMSFIGGEGVLALNSHTDEAFDVWSGIQEGQETFWEAGLAIQEKRRKRKFGGPS